LEDQVGKTHTGLYRELISQKIAKNHRVRSSVDAARMLVDLVRRSCFAGLQPAVTKRSGTAARSKALSDAATLLASGLQLEVAKGLATAAQRVVLDHGAILSLCGIAAGGC